LKRCRGNWNWPTNGRKNMKTELKPCPFCGGEANVFYVDHYEGYFIAKCNECGATIRRSESKEAIKAWNARKNPWHTGTPTEEGDYFVAFRWGYDNKIMHDMASRVLYGATTFVNGNWRIDLPYVVIAWKKIEPFKEENNG